MAIDASIYGNIKAPEAVNPVAQYAQMQQIKGLQTQGRLADLAYGEKEREVVDNRAMDEAYKASVGADGAIDRNALYGRIAQTQGRKLPGIQKGFAESDKATAEAQKNQFAAMREKLGLVGQILGGVKDQASYDLARQTATQNGLDISKMPPQFDPAVVAQKVNEALTAKDQLEQKWKQMEYTTPNANAILSSETSKANAATTDARARDLNAIKQEEVKLKRDAKQETADLTKNSQIASFDTMLGTLDRLGKHPGLARSVGITGALPTMPGSDSANFQAELNTFQSQAFIPMVAQLKGMGALSDAEGKKLTAAVGALDPKMGEQAFRDSVQRITDDMTAARARMVGGEKARAPGDAGTTGGWDAAKPITNAADYEKIPSGATYTDPNGKMRRKP